MSHFPLEGDSTPTTGAMSTVVANTNSQVANFAVDSALSGTSPTSSQSAASSQFQRLKVEDALSYLDQVKLQFGNQPQVYNDFLDIMKEFKSQSIDTPGVISRVSNLFKGHPDLIVGFNTFLPPGFKIEVHGQNEINIQGPAQHSHTLQQIAMRHNAAAAAAAAAAGNQSGNSQSQQSSPSSSSANMPLSSHQKGHQPVEFNHAINYVNKIKNRFQGQPDVYKAFLEILHTYQKEQRLLKDGGIPSTTPLSETEVYGQVSKLFQNQEDLLSEFGQFLPDATSSHGLLGFAAPLALAASKKQSGKSSKSHGRKSSQSGLSCPPGKRSKSSAKDVLAEAGRHGNYVELALFDKIHKSLHNQEVYDNFLRCLVLFNEEIVSRQELLQLITPFLGKFPDIFCQFKVLLGFKEPSAAELSPEPTPPPQIPPKERVTEFAAEIDFNSLKRHGASYRALPKTYVQPKCSGRTALCHEVLNDTWVSFPMWSEDTTFHGTRKTQYEEYIFRCEDERFELDVVLETNLSTIKVLEAVQKKISKMGQDELNSFTLDDRLGGYSEVIHRKAIHRIYGEKANDIIDGLKKNPSVAIPVVLKRLKSKQEDWLDAQRQFNKMWRDQLEKYHLKSLDHQGINFKATDTKTMRPKSLIGEVEGLYDERQENLADGKAPEFGPHLSFHFIDECVVFNDAIGLVMYYMKRASSLTKEEAMKVKGFLTHTLASFCFYPRVELVPDDDLSLDSDSDMDVEDESKSTDVTNKTLMSIQPDIPQYYNDLNLHTMYTNNTIYAFFRLLQFLCERLGKVYCQSLLTIEEHMTNGSLTLQDSVAVKLGLRKLPGIQVHEYYPTFLNLAKNFMEGNIDSSSYEDTCREMFGVHAYLTFTLDRLVQNIVRQLQAMFAEEGCLFILEEHAKFVEEMKTGISSTALAALEMNYQKKIEELLTDENCFKISMTRNKVLTIELLESDESSDDNGMDTTTKKCLSYVEQYSQPDSTPSTHDCKSLVQERNTFLIRTHRDSSNLSGMLDVTLSTHIQNQFMKEFDIHGAIEFKMDERTYRMIPLANSEDYMYRKNSLIKAKEVNSWVFTKQKARFQKWHQKWLDDHVSNDVHEYCKDWYLGLSQPNTTQSTEQVTETYNGQKRYCYKTTE